MTSHRAGLHHYHKRKRPTKTNSHFIKVFDKFMYFVAIVMPLTTIPQIAEIWTTKSAENVSLITWSAYVFSALCWLAYSIIHKEKVLIVNSAMWVLLEITVVIGVITYS